MGLSYEKKHGLFAIVYYYDCDCGYTTLYIMTNILKILYGIIVLVWVVVSEEVSLAQVIALVVLTLMTIDYSEFLELLND